MSVRKPGGELGTRREIKNLNSFEFMQQAIDYEVRWQIEQIEDGQAIQQATVLFNPDTGETRAMRTKEDAADYRYFPDPDLPPLVIADEWVEQVRRNMPEARRSMATRFVADYGLSEYDATSMTQSRAMATYFEATTKACGQPKLASNWIMGELSRRLNAESSVIEQCPVVPEALGTLLKHVHLGDISAATAKDFLNQIWAGTTVYRDGGFLISVAGASQATSQASAESRAIPFEELIDSQGLRQLNNSSELEKIVDDVLAANPKNVEEYKAGNTKALNALVGQIMKASKGKANPQQVNDLLRQKLG